MAGTQQVQESAQNVERKIDHTKLSPEQKEQAKRGYAEWVKEKGHDLYESWIPWIEDQYLSWFTKDNKASYATKQQLDKTKVTGVEGVDKLQDDLNTLVSGQVGQGGLLQPLGDAVSKHGINRAERGGKDEKGNDPSSAFDVGINPVASVAEKTGQYVSGGATSIGSNVKGVGTYAESLWKGGNDKSREDSYSKSTSASPSSAEPGAQIREAETDISRTASEDTESAAQQAASQEQGTVQNETGKSSAEGDSGYLSKTGEAIGSGVQNVRGYVGGVLGNKS
jgi:hypothetical protein